MECKVEYGGAGWEGDELAFGSKHHNFSGEEIEFQRVEEVDGTRLRVVEYVFDGLEPYVELRLLVALAYLVFPMRRKTFLSYLVHAARAYLHLDPIAVGAHHRKMQGLIAIGLGHGNPVAGAVGMQFVNICYRGIYAPAYLLFLRLVITVKHDSHRIEVVHFLEGYMLGLHLLPD